MGFLRSRFGVSRYDADENYRKAIEYYNMKNLDQAVLHMNSAIELLPRVPEYYAARGFFRLEDGFHDDAAADFDQALKFNAYEILANYGKGIIAYQAKEYETALQYFMNAWAADADRPETMYYIAMTYHRLQDNLHALQWMQQADAIWDRIEERDAKRRKRDAEKWLKVFQDLLPDGGDEGA